MSRKTTVFVLVLATFLAGAVTPAAAVDLKLGAHAGLTIPNLMGGNDNPYSAGFSSREGECFGITAQLGLSSHFSLVAEFNYTSQGGKREGMQIIEETPEGLPSGYDLYANFKNESILDYLEIPVMARYTFGSKLKFFVNAGPYLGYLVRAKAKTSGSSNVYLDAAGTEQVTQEPVSFDAETDVKDSIRPFNFGLAGGVGMTYPLGRGDLILDAHFQVGFTRLQKDATNGDSETGAVVITLGYLFNLFK